MDLIGMRFEARHLEVDGKLQEALDICRDILRHFATEPTSEQLLPVYVQASEISVKLGDRDGAATMLLRAAERYADAGMARPVIDLYQRLRRVGPGPRGLDLQFARRMLEHRHPTAAREFLLDLARRQKKEKLLATLERMAGWHADKVQQMLVEFLDRAQGLRISAAHAPPAAPAVQQPRAVTPAPPRSEAVTEVRPAVQQPEPVRPVPDSSAETEERQDVPAPAATSGTSPPASSRAVTAERPPAGPPPAGRSPPRDPSQRVTGPRRPVGSEPAAAGSAAIPPPARPTPQPAAARPSAPRPRDVMPADKVVFVTPGSPEAEPEPRRASPRAVRGPVVPPARRRSRMGPGRVVLGVVAVAAVAAGVALLAPRLRRSPVATAVRAPAPSPMEASGAAMPPATTEPPMGETPAGSVTVATVPARQDTVPVTPPRTPATPVSRPPPEPQAVATLPPVTQPRQPPPDAVRPAATAPAREPVRAPSPPPAPVPAPATPRVDYPVVVVDGLEIVEIMREGEEGAQRIVVRQLLASGDTLDLRESDLGEESAGVGAGRLLVRRHPSGGSMGTVRVGRFLVNARAPVEPEVLEEVLRKLTQRN